MKLIHCFIAANIAAIASVYLIGMPTMLFLFHAYNYLLPGWVCWAWPLFVWVVTLSTTVMFSLRRSPK